jgi:hypothetical protein
MTKTEFAAIYGAYLLADIAAGGLGDAAEGGGRGLREAEEAWIAARSPHVAGIMGKVERVADHVRDCEYGRLAGELDACEQELTARAADLAHVGDALVVLAHRFERIEMHDFFVRLLRSAALDAKELAELALAA